MIHKCKLNETDSINFKPKKEDIASLNNRITETKDVSIKELSELITQPYAHIFTPHYYEGTRNKANWISQSIFYLDFDNGTSLVDIMNRLEDLSIRPNIIYNTLSDSINLRKFRVVFFLDLPTYDYNTAYWIQSNLVSMFNDSDQSCKTVERMVFPGFSVLHLDEIENEVGDFLRVINTYIIGKDFDKTRKAKSIEIESDRFTINFTSKVEVITQDTPKIQQITKTNFSKMIEEIKILKDFDSGMKLSHMEIFGLATNFNYISGGLSYMKNKMEQVNKVGGIRRDGTRKNYDYSEFGVIPYVRKRNYLPQILSKFSPHREDHDFHNLIDCIKWKRGRIDILENSEKITLSKAEKLLELHFSKVIKKLNKDDSRDIFDSDVTPDFVKQIYIFKVPTGLGKTRLLENIGNATIASPTNKLKRELQERMKVSHSMTPEYPIFTDSKINTIIDNYIKSNLYTESSNMVGKIAKGHKVSIGDYIFTPTKEDVIAATIYKDDNELCRETKETVLTTHTRAIFDNSFKHDTIIFDEDPLDNFVEIGKTSIDFAMFDDTEFKKDVETIERWLRDSLGFGYIDQMPIFTIRNFSKFAEFCAMNGRPDIIRLLDSNFIYKDNTDKRSLGDIFYVKKKDIPAKNIIIMSATAPLKIYKYIFGTKLSILDISNVEKVGKVIQYTSKSWSKSCFNDASDTKIKELNDIIGDRPVITFSNLKKVFKNPVNDMHFGNTSGYDQLKGMDIAVAGTYNKPLHVYFFYAKIIGMHIVGSDNLLNMRIIEWNGFRFKAMTFENKILRDIQLSLIESELIQAVGRNRNLRENCETLLFSSQPLKISDKFIF